MNFKLILYVLALFLVFARSAHAYIDPGTGSFIFQLLIAGFLGSLFFVKTMIRSIKGYFKKKKTATETVEDNNIEDKINE